MRVPALSAVLLSVAVGACRSAPARPVDRLDVGARAAVERPDCAGIRDLDPVFFAEGSATLRLADVGPGGGSMRSRLDQNLAVLERCPAVTVRVFGYVAALDGGADAVALSQARADAVRDHYLDGGIAPERVTDASGRGAAPQARVATDTEPRPADRDRRVDTVPLVPTR